MDELQIGFGQGIASSSERTDGTYRGVYLLGSTERGNGTIMSVNKNYDNFIWVRAFQANCSYR